MCFLTPMLGFASAAALLTLSVAGLGPRPAMAQEAAPVKINVASTFPTAMPILGEAVGGLSDRVARMSGGSLLLAPHESAPPP